MPCIKTEYLLDNLIKYKAVFVTINIPDHTKKFDSRERTTNSKGRKMVVACTVGEALRPGGPSIFSDNTIVQNVVKLCTTVAL